VKLNDIACEAVVEPDEVKLTVTVCVPVGVAAVVCDFTHPVVNPIANEAITTIMQESSRIRRRRPSPSANTPAPIGNNIAHAIRPPCPSFCIEAIELETFVKI
jgi:hypothetical protein